MDIPCQCETDRRDEKGPWQMYCDTCKTMHQPIYIFGRTCLACLNKR